MIESDYLQILAFEWVDELGQHIQIRNCHRVTRNYFKNSGAFIRKMKRKIRKELRKLNFKSFNSFFEAKSIENRKYNVYDSDEIVSQTLNLRPNPNNFFGRNPMFNLGELGLINQENEEELLEEDYPDEIQDLPNMENFANPMNASLQNSPGLPKIKITYQEHVPLIPELTFLSEEELKKKNLIDQLKILYTEINEISLSIEAKIQFLKLDFYRKFGTQEFEKYLNKKAKIRNKIEYLKQDIRESFCSTISKKSKKFESENETIIGNQNRNKLKIKEKKKIKKKSREGIPQFYSYNLFFILNLRENV
jgi:hypothetical protein